MPGIIYKIYSNCLKVCMQMLAQILVLFYGESLASRTRPSLASV